MNGGEKHVYIINKKASTAERRDRFRRKQNFFLLRPRHRREGIETKNKFLIAREMYL
jgi:hypothetical protein